MLVTLVKDLLDSRTSVTVIDEAHLPNTAVATGDVTPQGWKIFSIVPEHIEKFGKKVEAVVANVISEVVSSNTANVVETVVAEVKVEVEKVVAKVEAEANLIINTIETAANTSNVVADIEKLAKEVETAPAAIKSKLASLVKGI
jgi:hypothetical protein